MSEFEVVLTSYSLVVALVIARLLEGLRDSFSRDRRYWIHCAWVINRLLLVVAGLLISFQARNRVDADAFLLLIIIASPSIVFLQANALVTSQPHQIEDWKKHYWSVKGWFFGANVLYVVTVFLQSTYGLAAELDGIRRYLPPAIGLTLSIVGVRSSSERIHGALAVVGLLNALAGAAQLLVLA